MDCPLARTVLRPSVNARLMPRDLVLRVHSLLAGYWHRMARTYLQRSPHLAVEKTEGKCYVVLLRRTGNGHCPEQETPLLLSGTTLQ